MKTLEKAVENLQKPQKTLEKAIENSRNITLKFRVAFCLEDISDFFNVGVSIFNELFEVPKLMFGALFSWVALLVKGACVVWFFSDCETWVTFSSIGGPNFM